MLVGQTVFAGLQAGFRCRLTGVIEIGGMPILWHIMKEYSYYGFNDFVICAGYKQHMIKEWFADYFLHTSDVTFDFTQGNEMIVHDQHAEPWRVTVVDTGLNTMTGGRIKRVQKYIGNETFMMTYGDGVCDVNIAELVKFHKQHGKLATLTAVVQEQQKGVLDIGQDNAVQAFREKSVNDGAIINAGRPAGNCAAPGGPAHCAGQLQGPALYL